MINIIKVLKCGTFHFVYNLVLRVCYYQRTNHSRKEHGWRTGKVVEGITDVSGTITFLIGP
jgi:hypothetical protein